MKKQQFLFIGGLHRSGTSILFKCLRDHPQISGFEDTGVIEDEGQHLQTVFPTAQVYGGVGRFGFDPAAHLDESSPLASKTNADELLAQWSQYWDKTCPVLLEKSPPTLIRTRYLQALFPDSFFVIVLRHPLAASFSTKKWKRSIPFHRLLEHWLVCHEQFDRDRKHLRSLTVLKFETFVADPQPILDSLYGQLGIDSSPLSRPVRSGTNLDYFAAWHKKEKGILSRHYVNCMVERFEERVNYFGYSLTDLARLENY